MLKKTILTFFAILTSFSVSSKTFAQDSVDYRAIIFGPIIDGGTSSTITNGGIITMGYFTSATSGNLFGGTWEPLVGPLSLNPSNPTISFDGSGNSSTVPGDWEFTTSDSYPSAGSFLAYRIDAPSGYFDYVADSLWTWVDPSTPPPTLPFDFDESGTWQGGTQGTVSLVPEPSSFAFLAGLLGLGLVLTRRRRA